MNEPRLLLGPTSMEILKGTPKVSSAEVSVPGLWADHIADALAYSLHMQKLTPKPAPLTRWQRFRLWSPRRWAARVLRRWAERLDPQGWED